ncbi:Cys-tRNA(Pro)/Cys-tRNA(Cys) deacylase OS=Castellaniella defragrans OX=75697 GN=HNR28_001320 PE=3 SV=1 [Castellaniella defragrans]
MPVWIETTLLDYDIVYLNGGRRGYLISVAKEVLTGALGAKPVQVALDREARA